jgi:hypothetical protein
MLVKLHRPPPGDQNLLADAFGVVEQDDATATAPCLNGAHHAGSACAQDYDINLLHSPSLIFTVAGSRFMMA